MEGLGPGDSGEMKVRVNGEPTETRGAATVADLVACYELPADALLIEHNGVALHRREWPDRVLLENDRIEFVRVVAGG